MSIPTTRKCKIVRTLLDLRKRRDSNPRSLAGRSLSSSAFARSGTFRDALTCGFRDGCNLWGAAVHRRTETQTETWWLLNGRWRL